MYLTNHNIPVAEFAMVTNKDDALKQGEIFGYPFLLKARFDAYDGRGNFVVKSEVDIDEGNDVGGSTAERPLTVGMRHTVGSMMRIVIKRSPLGDAKIS